MHRLLTTCFFSLLTSVLFASTSQLEQRVEAIDQELSTLAHFSFRSGVGSIGCRSMWYLADEHPEWMKIELKQETPIQEIILVPMLWRDAQEGFQADGFPTSFRIVIGTSDDRSGTVLGPFSSSDGLLPRVAPVIIPIENISASWIRIEALNLSRRGFDQSFVFQLAEVMVFNGSENVALRQPVTLSNPHPERSYSSWGAAYLVDGQTPYLMDAANGTSSLSFVSPPSLNPTFTIDLESELSIDRIQLHAMEKSDTAPQAFIGDIGITKNFLIEGACKKDFSDAVQLLKPEITHINHTGPLMIWHIPETTCRYIRLSDHKSRRFRMGFAEIELFSNDQNVTRGKIVLTNQENPERLAARSSVTLTDGKNLYGDILPVRDWLHQLARRHDLERTRPLLASELNRRYARQKKMLTRVSWLALLLAAAVGFSILIGHILKLRQISRIRERFSADLHDELGANLHAIGLLGDLAKEAIDSPEDLIETVDEIRALTERSGEAARHCADLQQAGIYGKLPTDMRRTARRIMADIDYTITIDGETQLDALKPRKQADLFLFYKESLVNISRHSGASIARIQLTAIPRSITLTIEDNGDGLAQEVPASLKRRARLLGGSVTIDKAELGGTCITLQLRTRKRSHGHTH